MNTKELLARYNLKVPHSLGKVLYVQPIEIKKHIFSQLGVRIAQLLFCSFGFAISLVMLYSGWQKENLWHGLIGILFFPFFFMIVLILKDLLRTTLIVVCDKGVARYTFNYALKICQSEFLDFKESTHCTQEEGFVDPHSPVNKKGYRIATTWFKGTQKCFCISYFKEDETAGSHPEKEAAQKAREAYELFCARSDLKNRG
jgi:hypothetical protein